MSYSIISTEERHFSGLHAALDVVARELKYLAFTEAPSRDDCSAFYRNLMTHDFPQFVALREDKIVGWCDVSPVFGQTRAHIGVLGIGLLPEVRHHGLGSRLMEAAIAKSWSRNLTRIELTVRADNTSAIKLYERFGFEHEGVRRRACFVEGNYHDLCSMGLLR